MRFTELILVTALVATMTGCSNVPIKRGEEKFANSGGGYTTNWMMSIKFPQWKYRDPCYGYRDKHPQYIEKSVEISNERSFDFQKVKTAILLNDARYRQEEDEFMRKANPVWFRLTHDVVRRSIARGQTQWGKPYRHQFFGSPRLGVDYIHYGGSNKIDIDRHVYKQFVYNPPAGYSFMSFWKIKDRKIQNQMRLSNYDADVTTMAHNDYVLGHWEGGGADGWAIFETPRSYYRCPREHPLYGTAQWKPMWDCVVNGWCSATIVPR